MNRRQLTLILVAALVIGGLGLWLRSRRAASYQTSSGLMGQKVLGDFDVNSIAQITIRHGTNQVNLVQKDEVWTIKERGGYKANFSEISEFLRKLWELKIIQAQTIGPSQLARLELTTEGEKPGTVVELRNAKGEVVRSVILGKQHRRQPTESSPFGGDEGWPDGRYVMVSGKTDLVSLVSESFSNIEPKPEQWLNKDFFKIEKVKSVAVTYQNATNSWHIARDTETSEWKLVDAKPDEKLDASKVSSIPNALAWPSFNDVVIDPKPEVTGLDKPTVAVFETFDGFTYTVKVGNKQNDSAYYLAMTVNANYPKERTPGQDEKPEDKEKLDKEFKEKTEKLDEKFKQEKNLEPWVFLVPKWSLDSLLKERHALMAEKKEEPKPATPASTTAHEVSPVDAVLPPVPPAPEPPKPPKPE
ncbi:MAG: DUF4340 domain-containing protein [Verrucomicrobia bacterium]|nr:DUF4340 domain-containing protein [Verrucomicrobiota bacterium]